MSTQVQEALPSYNVDGELGRDAMGIVISGTDRQLDRAVAIKQLPVAFAMDTDVRRRFGREARTLAAFAHPHIVPVYDFIEREGLCVLVMEAMRGGTLRHRFASEGGTMLTACAALLATCSALQYAHDRGVLHRDLTPENLMRGTDGTLKVTDFGIAWVIGGDETLTSVDGMVIGSPAYMAPEQACGLPLGPPTDVYSAGTVLYELLAGALPFSIEGEPLEVLERRVEQEPVPLDESAAGIPDPLVEVTMEALHRDSAARYPSAEEFGVAVARAAGDAFGRGWLEAADVTLRAHGPIAAAARRSPITRVQWHSDPSPAGDKRTGRAVSDGRSSQVETVRTTAASRSDGGALVDLLPEDLVPVAELISPPRPPVLALFATALLLVALLVVVSLGVAGPKRARSLPAGLVTVNGTDIGSVDSLSADLAELVPATVDPDAPDATEASYAQIGFWASGVALGTSRSATLEHDGGDLVADIDAERVRILSSGELTAEFRLLDADKRILRRQEFGLDPDRPFYLAATGVTGLVLLLFVLICGFLVTRPLRRGDTGRSGFLTMSVLGGVGGCAALLLAWSLGAPEPSPLTFVAATALGAATFAFLTRATAVLGRRRRGRRARARARGAV